jgi:hypothetical protein
MRHAWGAVCGGVSGWHGTVGSRQQVQLSPTTPSSCSSLSISAASCGCSSTGSSCDMLRLYTPAQPAMPPAVTACAAAKAQAVLTASKP